MTQGRWVAVPSCLDRPSSRLVGHEGLVTALAILAVSPNGAWIVTI